MASTIRSPIRHVVAPKILKNIDLCRWLHLVFWIFKNIRDTQFLFSFLWLKLRRVIRKTSGYFRVSLNLNIQSYTLATCPSDICLLEQKLCHTPWKSTDLKCPWLRCFLLLRCASPFFRCLSTRKCSVRSLFLPSLSALRSLLYNQDLLNHGEAAHS